METDMSEAKKFFTRMGDGSPVYMTEEEIRADIQEGMQDAVKRGKVQMKTSKSCMKSLL